MDEPSVSVVGFEFEGRLIKITVAIAEGVGEQRRRSLWRALGLIIKAKIEAVQSQITTVEQEFLAHIVLPDGQTVGRWLAPQLRLAYAQGGGMPTLLLYDRSGRTP